MRQADLLALLEGAREAYSDGVEGLTLGLVDGQSPVDQVDD